MVDRGCDTCLYLDGMNGICRLGLADEWTVRSCDTSMCSKYEMDPFYLASEGDNHNI